MPPLMAMRDGSPGWRETIVHLQMMDVISDCLDVPPREGPRSWGDTTGLG